MTTPTRRTSAFDFTLDNLPAPGYRLVTLNGQEYTLDSLKPHRRLDGKESRILTWSSICDACDAPFAHATGLTTKSPALKRRCEQCVSTDFVGLKGMDRKRSAQLRYGEIQKRSHEEAKAVREGLKLLAAKSIVSAKLSPSGASMRAVVAFNDRKRRDVVYIVRGEELRCREYPQADLSAIADTLKRLAEVELAKTLF